MRARKRAVAFLGAAAILAAAPPARTATPPTAQAFLRALNAVRADRSLRPLNPDPSLERAARIHSADMVRHGYFEHRDFPVRLWRCGAHGPVVGETLGWSVADGSATTRIVSMWLSSPAHRAILLRPTFRKLGIGIATGPFKGRPHAVVVTVDFEGT